MKNSFSLLALGISLAFLSACVDKTKVTTAHPNKHPSTTTQVLERPPTVVVDEETKPEKHTAPEPLVNSVPETVKQVGELPIGKSVPGKPGYVTSPFGSVGLIDVRGFSPGTEVRDPYSGKTFLVP
ncbi:MAG: hypothetical protein WCI46_07855 [Verrucomicrobiota bacterium]